MNSVINTNLNSLMAQRQLGLNAISQGTAMQRLSSGLRINSAKDDSAGLAISQRMTTQIKGVDQAARNTNDGISLAQTAEGALGSINDNLQRVRELAVQSANGTNSDADRAALQDEAAALIAENDRIASQTQFNGGKLLDGSFMAQQFQVGANRSQTVSATTIASMRSDALGTYNGFAYVGVGTMPGAASAITITLNGPGTVYTTSAVATDALAITNAINAADVPGLSSAMSNLVQNHAQTSVGAVNGTASITINGATINVDYVAGSSSNARQARLNTVAAAINQQSAAMGISAAVGPTGLLLFQGTGANTTISYNAGTATGSAATDFGLFVGTVANSTQIFYQAPTGSGVTSVTIAGAGIPPITTSVTQVGQSLSGVNIATEAGAASAIYTVDNALRSVSEARANLGALQNRFASTISNLNTSSENMSAARSRILDADFAQETTALSRAQILQQASTAMVAQANQSPQGVLALLR